MPNVPAAVPLVISQQVVRGISVTLLKSLRGVQIQLDESPLIAIMGTNCSGKTTLLHALACSYRPSTPNAFDYKFSQFFKPNTDAHWQGSSFVLSHSYRIGPIEHQAITAYGKAASRWTPRYENRPKRFVRLISIRESVPDIETISLNSMIHYNKTLAVDAEAVQIRDAAGRVLNRVYDEMYSVEYQYGGRRSVGVKTNGTTYSGLTMSSGEQRVFRILEAVFRSPKYALILIDEIDLFLHQDALGRLINICSEHCADKKKQLIFTTHFPPVGSVYDNVSVTSIHRLPDRTISWKGYSYEAIQFLTGEPVRPISLHVEDDVADAIVSKVAGDLGLRRYVNIGQFGPWKNGFSLGAGLVLSGKPIKNTLVLLDGDLCSKRAERVAQVKGSLTGNGEGHEEQRESLFAMVKCLRDMQRRSPEQVLHSMVVGLPHADGDAEDQALANIARGIVNVPERHGFVNAIIAVSGESREVALSKIVRLASRSPLWRRYVRLVAVWLQLRKTELALG
jgi:ABC-type lipoprotein export system ATPase subunit